MSERKHGSTKQAFSDVKNTFKPNNGEQNFQKQTPMKVFNKQIENVKVKTPTVNQKNNLSDETWEKCSYKKKRDDSYYFYKNAALNDEQIYDLIKRSNKEPEPVYVDLPKPPEFELFQLEALPDIGLLEELPELPPRKYFFLFYNSFILIVFGFHSFRF